MEQDPRCARALRAQGWVESLLLAAAFSSLALGPAGVRLLALGVVAGWALLLFYRPFSVLGYGGPTWPLKSVVIVPIVLATLPGVSPFWAAFGYGLAYLYVRTLGRFLRACSGESMSAEGAAARFAWGTISTLAIGGAYAAHPPLGAAASGLKEVLGALAAEAGASEEELGRRLQALGKKLEGLEIPRTKRDAVLATLEWLLSHYSDAPVVAGVRRDPGAYARAVLDAAGEKVPADLRYEVERALLAFYEEAFQDEVLGRLLSSEALSRLAERMGEGHKDFNERLRRLELELPEFQVARMLERPWNEFGKLPEELSFRALTVRAGLVSFHPEIEIYSENSIKKLTFDDLIDYFKNLEPGLHISLIVGQGGAGKTRLGYELAKRLEKAGWMSRALGENLQAQWLSGLVQYVKKIDPRPRGIFLLLDYAADGGNDQYREIVSQLGKLKEEVQLPIALLLIDRAPDFASMLGSQPRPRPIPDLGVHEAFLEGRKEWKIADLKEETAKEIFF